MTLECLHILQQWQNNCILKDTFNLKFWSGFACFCLFVCLFVCFCLFGFLSLSLFSFCFAYFFIFYAAHLKSAHVMCNFASFKNAPICILLPSLFILFLLREWFLLFYLNLFIDPNTFSINLVYINFLN